MPILAVPEQITERAQSLSDALDVAFSSENEAAEQLGLPYTTLRRALRPQDNEVERDTTWSKRLDAVETAFTKWRERSATPARRPSITEMLDSPEARASDPMHGLARAGGSIVAKGYDDDGLMYAVEIVFHVRPDARESRHEMGFFSAQPDTIDNSKGRQTLQPQASSTEPTSP